MIKTEPVLNFDEMWTGFRIAIGGAQEYFGVKADLATFSKAVRERNAHWNSSWQKRCDERPGKRCVLFYNLWW